ncbi:MAG: type II toxin-antitoxin system RelE/ParE family toxin [Sphingobacteriaceae bacterium]
MNKRVTWSLHAQKDLRKIKGFYDQRNKSSDYSKKLLKAFRNSANLIESYPEASILSDFENVRGFIILDYILFYEILEEHILILMVWDCRRDPNQIKRILKR